MLGLPLRVAGAEVVSDGGGQGGDAGVRGFSQGAELAAGFAVLFGNLLDTLFEASVGLAEFFGVLEDAGADFVDLALGVAPEGLVLFAVVGALFGDSGGYALDSV
jgi:hypothetical protein